MTSGLRVWYHHYEHSMWRYSINCTWTITVAWKGSIKYPYCMEYSFPVLLDWFMDLLLVLERQVIKLLIVELHLDVVSVSISHNGTVVSASIWDVVLWLMWLYHMLYENYTWSPIKCSLVTVVQLLINEYGHFKMAAWDSSCLRTSLLIFGLSGLVYKCKFRNI